MAQEKFNLDLAKEMLQISKEDVSNTKKRAQYQKSIDDTLTDIVQNQKDSEQLAMITLDLEERIMIANAEGNKELEKRLKILKKIVTVKDKENELQNNINDALLEAGDELLGGMASKLKNIQDISKKAGGETILQIMAFAAIAGGVISIVNKIAEQTDQIGESFGAIGANQFRGQLIGATAEAQKLGFGFEEVASSVGELSNNFGIAFGEAIEISESSMETARALGIGVDQAAQLTGMLMTMGGHSAETAQNFIKQTAALAASAGVAPAAVMGDIAESSEAVAAFTKDGGENIARAAVKARSMGMALSDVASAAESLLNFEESLTKEMEASVLIGRQLNLQKARELSLAGDLEGLQSELLKQVGSEAQWNELNVIQRRALADAIGVGVDSMHKMVTEAGKSNAELAKMRSLSVEEIVGKDAMSNITEFMNLLKSIGTHILNAIAYVSNLGGGLGILIPILTIIGIWVGYTALQGFIAGLSFKAMGAGSEVAAKGLTSLSAAGTAAMPTLGMVALVIGGIALAIIGIGMIMDKLPAVANALANAFVMVGHAITESLLKLADPQVFLNVFLLATAFSSLAWALAAVAALGMAALPVLGAVALIAGVAGGIAWLFGAGGEEEKSSELEVLEDIRNGINLLMKGFGGIPMKDGKYIDDFGNKIPKTVRIENSLLGG